MKLIKTKKFKSLLLLGILYLSLFFGGCSNNIDKENITIGTNNINEINDNPVPKESVEAYVERVVDGDTIKVKLKNSKEIVSLRLLLVDTPESVKPGIEPQPYSIDASNFAKQSLKVGDKVYLEYDNGQKTDKYNRHLCYLWFYSKEYKCWKMFNEVLVEKGFARVGYVYSQKRYLNTLYDAQDRAKSKKLNIWSVNGYVTDKGFDVNAYNKGGASISNNFDSTNQTNLNEIVYANGGNSASNKYHSSRNAHGMKGAIKMTKQKAKFKGYEACGVCY